MTRKKKSLIRLKPVRNKDGDFSVAPVQEPVDADLDAFAGEPLLVAVTHGHVAAVDDDRQLLQNVLVFCLAGDVKAK